MWLALHVLLLIDDDTTVLMFLASKLCAAIALSNNIIFVSQNEAPQSSLRNKQSNSIQVIHRVVLRGLFGRRVSSPGAAQKFTRAAGTVALHGLGL